MTFATVPNPEISEIHAVAQRPNLWRSIKTLPSPFDCAIDAANLDETISRDFQPDNAGVSNDAVE